VTIDTHAGAAVLLARGDAPAAARMALAGAAEADRHVNTGDASRSGIEMRRTRAARSVTGMPSNDFVALEVGDPAAAERFYAFGLNQQRMQTAARIK
jgi:hypothetical protein